MIKTIKLNIKPLGQSPRLVYIYLPDNYDQTDKLYDVLYMFDGHNLFDDSTATYGKSWGMKKYLDKNRDDLIIVGVDCNHYGNKRLDEYCPFIGYDRYVKHIKDDGKITARWFVETLKPAIEKRFRVHSSREHVGIAGSSMGGLMSIYMISQYNDVFSKAACLSSSTEMCFKKLLNHIRNTNMNKDTKIYLNFGANETNSKKVLAIRLNEMLQINHEFTKKGCDTYCRLLVNGYHDEATWEKCLPDFLNYLYPNGNTISR